MKLNIKKIIKISSCSIALVLLSGCQITDGIDRDIKPYISDELNQTNTTTQKSDKVPESLADELLSGINTDLFSPNELEIKRFEVSANQVEVRDFFVGLVADTPYSVAIHPDVSGKISLSLKDVTLDEVIKVIARMYKIDVFREGKIVQVLPSVMRTESIPVSYLMMKRSGVSTVSVVAGGVSQFDQGSSGSSSSGNLSNSVNNQDSSNSGSGLGNGSNMQVNGASIQTSSESDFWHGLKLALESIIGNANGRYIIVSPQASLVTIHALPSEIFAIKDFLKKSQESLQRQVILEAKIIEVSLNDDYQQGVNWSNILSHIGNTKYLGHLKNTDFNFSTSAGGTLGNTTTANLGGVSSLVFANADFNGVINLLETQGDVQMLSNPRVTATNNQKAVIKVGQDEYFVTEVSSTTVTGNSTTTTPEIELTPFFSGIALDVTPQIDEFGSVILHVHPSVTKTEEQNKVITLNNEEFVLPLAHSNIREADTVIRAGSGEIVVIGGLMETLTVDEESQTPLLGDIPFFGGLFKSIHKTQVKKELIILIRPTVVMADSWQQQQERTMKLLKSWYSH